MIGIINNGIVCQDSGIYNYIPVIDWECNDIIDHINNIIGAESSNNDIVIVCQQYLDSLESYEAISSNERNLINAFIDSLINENLTSYTNFKSSWSTIADKKQNGIFSASIISIGSYSHNFWITHNAIAEPPNPSVHNRGGPLADLAGAVVGYARYMYNNWSHHYEEDFGKNALMAGGDMALNTSFGYYTGKIPRK